MPASPALPLQRRATEPSAAGPPAAATPGRLHRNLVVLRAGDSSLHPAWYTDDREFDIVVDAYGTDPDRYLGTCDELHRGLGETGSLAQHRLFTDNPRYLADYDCIWIPDDDIAATTADVNRLFRLHRQLGLALAQPALSRDSYFAHSILVQHEGLAVRQTNFVEPMVPIFTSDALAVVLPTLAETRSGWGLDSVWPSLLAEQGATMGVYDCVTVTHTRAPGAAGNQGLSEQQAQEEAEALTRRHGVPTDFRPTVLAAWDDQLQPLAPDALFGRLVEAFPHETLHPQLRSGWDSYGRVMRRALLRSAASRLRVRRLQERRATSLAAGAPAAATPGRLHRNLVVLRAGDSSLHPAWYTDDREFDIVVDAYGTDPDRYLGTCDELHRGLGETGSLAQHRLFTDNPRYLADYDCIWIPDDDIAATTAEVNTLFRLHRELGFDLGQPALTPDSYFTHSLLVRHEGFAVRQVNFVETMMPIFTSDALAVVLPTLAQSRSGWGLEVVWQTLLGPLGGRSAVYDCVAVTHTRPAGSQGLQGGSREDAVEEQRRLVSRYQAPPPGYHVVQRAWDPAFAPVAEADLALTVAAGFPRTSAHPPAPWDLHHQHMQALVTRRLQQVPVTTP